MMNPRVRVLIFSNLYHSNIVVFVVHMRFDLCFSYLVIAVSSIFICVFWIKC
jgi:hypothetical protein